MVPGNYLLGCERGITENPKNFWSFVNSKSGNSSIPASMTINGQELNKGQDISNAFATFFESVFTTSGSMESFQNYYAEKNFNNTTIRLNSVNDEDVIKAVKAIKSNAMGPDGIPAYVFKGCIEFLCRPLTIIFNMCIESSKFPNCWKEAKVCPIYKSGDRSDISNYRAISILSAPSKALEHIIYENIFVDMKKSISESQHGFMPSRSTVTNLSNMTQYISQNMDNRLQTDSIYTDLTKAFDKICHARLILKLQCYGFSNNLIALIKDYLDNRKLFVIVNNYKSNSYFSTSGVPQGSNLGPLLFLLFFNDIVNVVNYSLVLLYADDLKLIRTVTNTNDCELLQLDINNVSKWTDMNALELNISKCFVVSFTKNVDTINFNYVINNSALERRCEVKDLGVIFDSKMTFNGHISFIKNSAMKLMGFITRNTKCFQSTKPLDVLYTSHVRSKLEYAAVIWSPFYEKNIYSLESVQSRYLKCKYFRETGTYLLHERTFLLNHYNMLTLEKRRIIIGILYLHGILNNLIDNPEFLALIHIRVPRSSNNRIGNTFSIPIPRTNVMMNSPIYRILNNFNNLCNTVEIFNTSKSMFKKQIETVID